MSNPQVHNPQGLTEAAPVIRAALTRLHGRTVVITNADGVAVTNGKLVVVEGLDGPLLPSLTLEFSLRGIVFAMEIPLVSVFRLVGSSMGDHYVFRLPPDNRLSVEMPPGQVI